jgi:hypothetical protein
VELVAVIAGLILSVGALLLFRRTHDPVWNEKWRAVDPERKRRISKAVGAGRALDAPDDASLAVRLVEATERWRRFSTLSGLGTAAFLGVSSIALGWHWLLLVAVACIALEVVATALMYRPRRRMREARQANLALLNR